MASDSLSAIIEAFLEWSEHHRSPVTYEWYRFRLKRFFEAYPDLRIGELRPYHVQEWIDRMTVASGTKRNYCRAVKRCVRWAKKQGYIDQNPIADLEVPRGGKREKVVTAGEWDTILAAVPDRYFRDLLVVTWETGCRPQESLRVEARHVDLVNQRWVFPESESKTDIPRVVYLTDEALAITKRLMLQHPSGPLFRNLNGPWTTDAVNCAFIRLQIKLGRALVAATVEQPAKDKRRKYLSVDEDAVAKLKAKLNPLKKSGVAKTEVELLHEARRKLTYRQATEAGPKYSLYVIRHTWMNRLLTSGVDALTVAFLAGHKNASTLANHYAHLSQNPSFLLTQAKKAAS
ncbi:MAG: tyrosine-type recombinase/integrase [Planctomycetaceae bacterium]